MNILGRMEKIFTNNSDFSISYEKNNLNDYLWSDTIISDWSGSAIEYSLATKKTLYLLNTEQKVRNKNAKSYEKDHSFENYFRNNIGLCIEKENISDVLINLNKNTFLNLSEEKIDDFRLNYLYNFLNTQSAVKKFIELFLKKIFLFSKKIIFHFLYHSFTVNNAAIIPANII